MARTVHYLVSAAGIPNYGDDAITAGWLRYLAASAPDDDVVLDCVGPERAAKDLGGLHSRARFTDALWRLSRAPGAPGPGEAVDRVERAVDAVRPRSGASHEELRPLLAADTVHVLGGGYLNGLCPPHLGLLAGVGAAVRRSGGRASLTGIGLAPAFLDGGSALRRAVAPFQVVDVRDEVSARILGRADVTCTGDDLFLDLGYHTYRGGRLPEVMLCAQSPALLDLMQKTVEEWGVPESSLGLVECDPGDDHEVFAEAQRRWPAALAYPAASLTAHGMPAATGQTWITSRFHPHLVAAAAGASGVAVEHGPADYYAVKHRSLVAHGSAWLVTDDRTVPPRPGAGGFSARTVAERRAAKQRLAHRIHGA
ncbi:polysaccharide pyruvyl transferase family protein [Streptomyces sp. NPDC048417]|uniref:polysaccharide pyruvyl transferase family protein n=1 Tax=Streptomyces sp. NPDC048417 TaxID=3155387 RepID=UPI0034320416